MVYAACVNGDLRIDNGSVVTQGYVEYCLNGAWSPVCTRHGQWGPNEVTVACRQLGYQGKCSLQVNC